MKQIAALLFVAALIISCSKSETAPPLQNKILGNWQAVNDSYQQIAPEWGFIYEASIKLYADKSFAINVPAGANDNTVFKLGTYELKNNNTSIIFYSVLNDAGTIQTDT